MCCKLLSSSISRKMKSHSYLGPGLIAKIWMELNYFVTNIDAEEIIFQAFTCIQYIQENDVFLMLIWALPLKSLNTDLTCVQ